MADRAIEFLKQYIATSSPAVTGNVPAAVDAPLATDATGALVQSGAIVQDPEIQRRLAIRPRPAMQPYNVREAQAAADYVAANTRDNVPIDVLAGAPATKRAAASFFTTGEDILKFWQNAYGKENVRLGSDGVPLIRVRDEMGHLEDVRVDEMPITLKDLSDLAGDSPEIIGNIVGAIGGRRLFGPGVIRQSLAGGVSGELAGAAKDLLARESIGVPANAGEVATRRALNLPGTVGLDVGMGYGGKVLGKIITPFGRNVPAVQIDARRAREFWLGEGVDMPYSGGQRTGSPFLLRSEAIQRELPGASGAFSRLDARQQAAVRQMQNITQGLPAQADDAMREAAIETAESVTARVSDAVRAQNAALAGQVGQARTALAADAMAGINTRLAAATGPARQLNFRTVGEALRTRVASDFGASSDNVSNLYEALYNLPGGGTRTLNAGDLIRRANAYLDSLPPRAQATGPVTARTRAGTEPNVPFSSAPVLRKLRGLRDIGNTPLSLRDLVNMRTEVDNAIAEGVAIPDVSTHHLSEIRRMITEHIESEATRAGGGLRQAWDRANTAARQHHERFDRPNVRSLLIREGERGAVGNEEIVNRILEGKGDDLLPMRQFLGATSPEYTMLRRAIADRHLSGAMNPGPNTLNAQAYIRELSDLRTKSPDTFREIYGHHGDEIIRQAQRFHISQADNIDAAIIEQGVRNPRGTPNLRRLIDSQRALDDAYRNDIRRAIGHRNLPTEGLDPAKFVNTFVDSASPNEVREIMGMLDEATAWQVRAKTVQKLLSDAARARNPTDRVALALNPNQPVSSKALEELVNSKERLPVLREILGDDGIERVRNLAIATRPLDAASAGFTGAGRLASSTQVQSIYNLNISHFLDKVVHNWLGGFLINAPAFRQWVGNTRLSASQQHSLVTAMISSAPVMEQLVKDFGSEGAIQVTEQIKRANDASFRAAQGQGAQGTNAESFLQQFTQP